MGADRILQLKLIGDVAGINKAVTGTSGRLASLGKAAKSWGIAIAADLAIQGVHDLTNAVGDAFAGFKSGEIVAAQLGNTWKNLGLDGSKLSGTLKQVTDSTLALGTSDDEAVQQFNNLLQKTGKVHEAMRLLAISQNVAAARGISLAAASKLVQQGVDGSAGAMRKLGIHGDTAQKRMHELNKRYDGAAKKLADLNPLQRTFNQLGENLETIVGGLATGDLKSALGGVSDLSKTLGTAWDEASTKIGTVIGKLWTDIQAELAKVDWGVAFGTLVAALQKTLQDLGTHADVIAAATGSAVILGGLFAGAMFAIDGLSWFLKAAFGLIPAAVGLAVTAAGLLIGAALDAGIALGVAAGPEILMVALIGLVAAALVLAATAIFKLDWASIFDGLIQAAKDIGQNVADALSGAFDKAVTSVRDGINGLIDAWNGIVFHIPKLSVDLPGVQVGGFQLIPETHATIFDGADIGTPNIPRLARGGVVNRPTLAMIGEAGPEAVVPLGRSGGMGGITVNFNGLVTDPAAAGRAVVDAIKSYERREGKVWRTA